MDQQLYDFHKNAQFNHWWFLGRNKVIEAFIGLKNHNTKNSPSILDIGSGFGACIPLLKKIGVVDALEPYKESHAFLKTLGASQTFECKNFPLEYPPQTYDCVTMFDVLEHIQDDFKALEVIKGCLLKSKGKIIITVPAYMWLWSDHDVKNMHFRRYNQQHLKKLLKDAGYKNIKTSYFMTFLFPLALMERFVAKITKRKTKDTEESIPPFNSIFRKIFFLESYFLKKVNFPFGLSLIATAEID